MRLRYLHLKNYPPISDIKVCFSSGSPLARECAIHFVVGVNGSGKSNLLRAVAEVFLALADGRRTPFPVQLIYELGHRDSPSFRTLVLDWSGDRETASLWIGEQCVLPDSATSDQFDQVFLCLSTESSEVPTGFRPLIAKGEWPSGYTTPEAIALPLAVLAYTTGDLRPWRSVWNRNQQAQGLLASNDDVHGEERPAGWTTTQENALQAARQSDGDRLRLTMSGVSSVSDNFRRPILVDATLLKCALLAVTLPQAFIETTDYPGRTEIDASMAQLRRRDNNKNALQELLERGGWHHLVSVGFCTRMQAEQWDQRLCKTAHDWWLCASEVIAEPHPTEQRRGLLYDLKGSFDPQGQTFLSSARDELQACTSHGEALWILLGGAKDASAFDLFIRMLALNQAGLFDDVLLRLRRHVAPELATDASKRDIGVMRYEELSDGEQMFMGRMALLHLLSGRQDSLLLLDEPETHFNDLWKRDVVSVVDDALANTSADVLIATHAALMLTDALKDELVVLERISPDGDTGPGESGTRMLDSQTHTFGATGDHPLRDVFGAPDTVGKRASRLLDVLIAMAQFGPEVDEHWRRSEGLSEQLLTRVLEVARLTQRDVTLSQVRNCLVSFEHFAMHFGVERPLTMKAVLEAFIHQTGPGYFLVELKRAWRRLLEGAADVT